MTTDDIYGATRFCMCGEPHKALELLRDVLAAIYEARYDAPGEAEKRWHQRDARMTELLGAKDGPVFWWFMYFLDMQDMTEHGGGVGGCWLTDNGKGVLAFLSQHGCEPDNWPKEDEAAVQ